MCAVAKPPSVLMSSAPPPVKTLHEGGFPLYQLVLLPNLLAPRIYLLRRL